MNVHEYQAKVLFSQYQIPVPQGMVIHDLAQLEAVPGRLGGDTWIVKAQIHAGGRGQGGGVRRAQNQAELQGHAQALLHQSLITAQTSPQGLKVSALLVEAPVDVAQEFYLGLVLDRTRAQITVMASAAGGVDIEAHAVRSSQSVITTAIDPAAGFLPYHGRKLGFALGLAGEKIRAFGQVLDKLYQLFVQCDASLVEVNPLGLTQAGGFIALDAKLTLDDNALYRHPDLATLRDVSQEAPTETRAREYGLNYIKLNGEIGCMVNGAGLAMATMDLIQHHGGTPANFLDVGGTTTAERVAEAFKLILSDSQVKAVLVNIFGGIVRCDLIAEGIIQAIREVHVGVPVVVRLEGTNAEAGRARLAASGLDVIPAADLDLAAREAVATAHQTAVHRTRS